MKYINSIITGTGVGTPINVKTNADFHNNSFFDKNGIAIDDNPQNIVSKFEEITGIAERRYANQNMMASDLAVTASIQAIENAKIDPETLDYIIVAQNFGDIIKNTIQTDMVPALASRVKHKLGIKNPECVAYDIIFGCPGWIQAMIQADMYIKSGMAKKCLVIGAEALSRVLDPHDRDSMIFADGAGATILEAIEGDERKGIIGHKAVSHTLDEAYYIRLGSSNYPDSDERVRYIKMDGRKIYEFALTNVPKAMKECLDNSGVDIKDVKKIFIHQANEKMDEAILKRFYKLYKTEIPEGIMPMSIQTLGNSSVATVPTLFDLVKNNKLENQSLTKGDVIIFASVGAGMHINAIVYRY